jgi:uncharacterized membrane protein
MPDITSSSGGAPLATDIGALAALLVASGTTHLVRPQVFEPIVPHLLPYKRQIVYVSGVAEILCGLGLLARPTRRVAGLASAALLVAVFPANAQMTADYARRATRRGDAASQVVLAGTVARLPLQWPMIRTALRAAGRG